MAFALRSFGKVVLMVVSKCFEVFFDSLKNTF